MTTAHYTAALTKVGQYARLFDEDLRRITAKSRVDGLIALTFEDGQTVKLKPNATVWVAISEEGPEGLKDLSQIYDLH